MMGDTFKYVASVAGAYNITAEDTALAIGLMANRGIKASQAGTALRNVFSRLATDAGASAESLGALGIVKEMGVDFYDAEGKVRDLSEFLPELRGKWRDLDPQTAAEYAKKIAGMYGMSGFLGLMNATDEEVAQLQEDIANRAGAAQTMMDTIIDNRKEARAKKDWATSDLIRDELAKYDIVLKDGKEGTTWSKK